MLCIQERHSRSKTQFAFIQFQKFLTRLKFTWFDHQHKAFPSLRRYSLLFLCDTSRKLSSLRRPFLLRYVRNTLSEGRWGGSAVLLLAPQSLLEFVPWWKILQKEKAGTISLQPLKQIKNLWLTTMKRIVRSNPTFAKSDTIAFSKKSPRMETWFYFCLNANYPYRKTTLNLWWALRWFMKMSWKSRISRSFFKWFLSSGNIFYEQWKSDVKSQRSFQDFLINWMHSFYGYKVINLVSRD